MTQFASWQGSLTGKLAGRLEQLQENLASLKTRLRAILTDILGRALSEGVHDAVHGVLDAFHGDVPDQQPTWRTSSSRRDPGRYPDEAENAYPEDDWPTRPSRYAPEPFAEPIVSPKQTWGSWPSAVSAALRTAIIMLSPSRRRRHWCLALVLSLLFGGFAYWRPSLALLGLDLMGSAVPMG
ncbi:MAG TPA: hypothetical protein VHR72_00055 [Gemmataceae bacterium]|jgi:hypothetical protein|nr:hypothetical protein [Gemmataceae bacterium]